MKCLLVGCVLTLMMGCAAKESNVRTVRVEVPVLVPCNTEVVTVPPWATTYLKKTDGLELKVRALLAERRQRIAYEAELVAMVGSCR